MTTKVGINGFGRIGRQLLKILLERYPGELEVVGINDLWDPATNAQLFKYDSNYGPFNGTIELAGDGILVDGKLLKAWTGASDPARLREVLRAALAEPR